jgi:hypothetical protein
MKKKVIKTVGSFKNIHERLVPSLNTKFKCDGCKSIFTAREIELKEYHKENFNMINPMLSFKFFRESDQSIIGTSNTTTLPEDIYYTLHCPKCHDLHLGGMDVAK